MVNHFYEKLLLVADRMNMNPLSESPSIATQSWKSI